MDALSPSVLAATLKRLEAQASELQAIVAEADRGVRLYDAWLATPGLLQPDRETAGGRYGELLAEAALVPSKRDYVWLGIIDWHYRIQRPQHLATHLADLGNRIFYISIEFEPAEANSSFRIISSPHPGVYEVRLQLAGSIPANIYSGLTPSQTSDILDALEEFGTVLPLRAPAVVVQYPSWLSVALSIPGSTVVHDCLDLIGGFSNVPREIIDLEDFLIKEADLVVTTSQPLSDHVRQRRANVLIRNAAEVEFFGGVIEDPELPPDRSPVIGYFGALDHWFSVEWLETCARRRPNWRFSIIGRVTGADVTSLEALSNVDLLGERPYAELPEALKRFDVAIIPFEMNELIRCVNPIKLYEYMSQGKPVVSCAMPEVINATDLAYIAHDAAEFEEQIVRALREDSPDLRTQRKAWASGHGWKQRALDFQSAVDAVTPSVSVVVLCYNNWRFTRDCLHSLLVFSDYPNFEIIVVDNASTDRTRRLLTEFAAKDDRVRVIFNEENLGFAAGNNVGIRASVADYVVLLNNDTYVTRGWIRDLIRPLVLDPSIGLAGPLTNNIGNEAKVIVSYETMAQMAKTARRLQREHARRRYEVSSLAFFCVAMRRDIIERVGLLDEAYGMGFFEDDDFCKRVLEAGYRIVIADDVFIHHELSASFDALVGSTKADLFRSNKEAFERRWGPWMPHVYREQPGFGA